MKDEILKKLYQAVADANMQISDTQKAKITLTNPDASMGDFATNIALVLSKDAGRKPLDIAKDIVGKLDQKSFSSVKIAGPGFINLELKSTELLKELEKAAEQKRLHTEGKILLEYFQPNIAKPLHIGHMQNAIIGDSLKRIHLYMGKDVESDTHLGDWGTQFGILILAYRMYGDPEVVARDPITELNKLYVRLNQEIETNPDLKEQGKQEFVKLEQGDPENRKLWKQFVDWSKEKFSKIHDLLDISKFEHDWPESFYEDKMPGVLDALKSKGILTESQGAQIVNLEDQNLGVAVIVKSDGGTTYLLRDLATFIYVKKQGFRKHLYVVDNRQAHHYHQLFAILKLMGEMEDDEGLHIAYGFISFKGEALSSRKGNMVLAEDVLNEARKRVAKIIKEKNPALADKDKVIRTVSIGAIKYFILSHNRNSDIEFNWDQALDFDGNSGPYLLYAHARLSGILNKVNVQGSHTLEDVVISGTERELIIKCLGFNDVVAEVLRGYLPNLLANYLFEFSGLINKFYHESPVMKESDEKLKFFRLKLITRLRDTLAQGLNLLGIEALDEM
ncbi:MAG: arginine--tRNA ligase [Candidatus Doudnabacteria bacterium]|nr:arginine--tRNA ligase [Candidatus Doudnabacteria bacterium]